MFEHIVGLVLKQLFPNSMLFIVTKPVHDIRFRDWEITIQEFKDKSIRVSGFRHRDSGLWEWLDNEHPDELTRKLRFCMEDEAVV